MLRTFRWQHLIILSMRRTQLLNLATNKNLPEEFNDHDHTQAQDHLNNCVLALLHVSRNLNGINEWTNYKKCCNWNCFNYKKKILSYIYIYIGIEFEGLSHLSHLMIMISCSWMREDSLARPAPLRIHQLHWTTSITLDQTRYNLKQYNSNNFLLKVLLNLKP